MPVIRHTYTGDRAPAEPFFAHWRAFRAWAREHHIQSADPDIVMLGYEPPGAPGLRTYSYEACIPLAEPVTATVEPPRELATFPGGQFILVAGDLTEMPELYRAARRHAGHNGLAFERGGLEIYRPHPTNPRTYRVEAGVGIHG